FSRTKIGIPSAVSSLHSPPAFSSFPFPATAPQSPTNFPPPVSAPIPKSRSTHALPFPPPYPKPLPLPFFSSLVPSISSAKLSSFSNSLQQNITTNAASTSGAPFQPINPPIHQSINPLRSVRAITFDVGGTLIQPWPSVGHIYAEVAARHGLNGIPVETLNRQFATAWRNLRDFNYTSSEWHSLVNQTFLGLTRVPVSGSFFSDLSDGFGKADAWRIFDDVLPALEFLKVRGLKLGIISNWDERLRPLLRQLNIERFFQSIVVSCEAGACKPSAAIFRQAAQKL